MAVCRDQHSDSLGEAGTRKYQDNVGHITSTGCQMAKGKSLTSWTQFSGNRLSVGC